VDHVRSYYKTDTVDVVVSTHPDRDHVTGLSVVLDELIVGELWIHQPNATEMQSALGAELFGETSSSRRKRLQHLRASLQDVQDLIEKARAKGIPLVEPFVGVSLADGAF